MGAFLRTALDDNNFVRGAARIMVEPVASPYPSNISQIVQLSATAVNDVQTLTTTGVPTGGTFTLTFNGATTTAIAYNASAATVQAALQALTSIGSGNITAAGGPLPTAVVLTFAGSLAGQYQNLITGNSTLLTGGTTPAVVVAHTTSGQGQYDAQGAWADLGATKTGIQLSRNNTEEVFDVDQVFGEIQSQPTAWEMMVRTSLAEATLAHVQIAWEGGAITVDATQTVPETHLGLGSPTTYVQRRLAILYQRANGNIRAVVLRKVQKMPQESTFTYAKTGEQIVLPVTFRALVDPTVADPNFRFGEVIDQAN
jgi:hypothetical protein